MRVSASRSLRVGFGVQGDSPQTPSAAPALHGHSARRASQAVPSEAESTGCILEGGPAPLGLGGETVPAGRAPPWSLALALTVSLRPGKAAFLCWTAQEAHFGPFGRGLLLL